MISNREIKDVVEFVTQGTCVVQTVTTPAQVIVIAHVHAPLFERMDSADERLRFLETSFFQEVQRRGLRNVPEYLGFEPYPTIEYQRNPKLQTVFKQHASQAN